VTFKSKADTREWEKVKAVVKSVTSQQIPGIQVGVFQDAGMTADGRLHLAELAAIHEYGSANLPQRSFIRAALRGAQGELKKLMARITKAMLALKLSADTAWKQLGSWAVNVVQTYILSGSVRPALKPSTVKAKGNSTPLFETGLLVGAVSWRKT
jgi:hypothetical protein